MLQGLRRSALTLAPRVANGMKNKTSLMGGVISRNMVDMVAKEQGEELTYIRRLENERKMKLKQQMDEILDREHSDEDKQALINMIGIIPQKNSIKFVNIEIYV